MGRRRSGVATWNGGNEGRCWMLFDLAIWIVMTVGFGVVLFTYPNRQEIRVLTMFALAFLGSLCGFASLFVGGELAVVWLKSLSTVGFLGAILFYFLHRSRSG
jgi:hypothetical protein